MSNIKLYSSRKNSNFYATSQSQYNSHYLTINNDYNDININDPDITVDIFNQVSSMDLIDSGLLPPGVRHISPGLVVFERPPSMQLVQYINNSVEEITNAEDGYTNCDCCDDCDCDSVEVESLRSYYIPVPWQLYIATYSTLPTSKYMVTSIRMFFMNSPLNHPDVNLYAPYIPNFFMSGLLCNPMFDTYDEINKYQKNISGVIESTYDWVWNTGFNADLYECVSQSYVLRPNSLIQYETPFMHNIVDKFYKIISECSLYDVTEQPWVNPSFNAHYTSDTSNLHLYDFALPMFLEATGINHEPESDTFQQEFRHWLKVNVQNIPKTYTIIMDYLTDPNNRIFDLKSSSEVLNNTQTLANTMSNLYYSKV